MVAESQFAFKAQEWCEGSGSAPMDLSTMNTGNTVNTESTETKQTKRNTCCGCSSVAAVVLRMLWLRTW